MAQKGAMAGTASPRRDWAPLALGRATWRASLPLAVAWWGLIVLRALLSAGLTVTAVSSTAGGRPRLASW